MSKLSFFAELQRRHVYKVGAAYAVGGWLLAQVITQVLPVFNVSLLVQRILVLALIAGFPVALVLAWLFDVTPNGIVRTESLRSGGETPIATHARIGVDRKLNWVLGLLLVSALGVVVFDHTRSSEPRVAVPAAAAKVPSIAVLPFVNESGDKDQQYFSDGLSEDLITALSQLSGLRVIGRSSSFQFRDGHDDAKGIGARLAVGHLLEGSVRRVGEIVRISAELVDVSDGHTLWSQHYDRPYVELFKLQDEITAAVAVALKAKLAPVTGAVEQNDRPPSGNLDAYNAYLQGRQFADRFNAEDEPKAIASFEKAVALDPQYAFAYFALGRAWDATGANFVEGAATVTAHEKGRAALERALALEPDLAEAHSSQAIRLLFDAFDLQGAEAEARLALKLAPNAFFSRIAMGVVLMAGGHTSEAINVLEAARADDPLSRMPYLWLSVLYAGHGNLEAAEHIARIGVDNEPSDGLNRFYLIAWQILRGEDEAARQTAAQTPPGDWQVLVDALAAQAEPDRAAADAALEAVIQKQGGTAGYQIAEIYALRKQADEVFAWLNRASKVHDPGLSVLTSDALFAPYRADPRFTALCARLHLPLPKEAASPAPPPKT